MEVVEALVEVVKASVEVVETSWKLPPTLKYIKTYNAGDRNLRLGPPTSEMIYFLFRINLMGTTDSTFRPAEGH